MNLDLKASASFGSPNGETPMRGCAERKLLDSRRAMIERCCDMARAGRGPLSMRSAGFLMIEHGRGARLALRCGLRVVEGDDRRVDALLERAGLRPIDVGVIE